METAHAYFLFIIKKKEGKGRERKGGREEGRKGGREGDSL